MTDLLKITKTFENINLATGERKIKNKSNHTSETILGKLAVSPNVVLKQLLNAKHHKA